MTVQVTPLSRQLGEKTVRVGIAIVGLLVFRGLVSIMPMLRSQPVYIASLPGLAVLDRQKPLTPDQIQQALSAAQLQGLVDDLQNALRANPFSRSPGDDRGYAVRIQNEILMNTGLALFPVTIAKAIIDTLIFAFIVLFGFSLADLFRGAYERLPDLGLMLNLGIIATVVALAYYAYQGLAYPFLFPDNGPVYGWVFLVLILAPLVALAVVVARNLDAITTMVMNSGSAFGVAPAAIGKRCASCGHAVAIGARFCPHCGAGTSTASAVAASGRACPSCGTANVMTAKYCKECGQSV